jgi:urease beta subunit
MEARRIMLDTHVPIMSTDSLLLVINDSCGNDAGAIYNRLAQRLARRLQIEVQILDRTSGGSLQMTVMGRYSPVHPAAKEVWMEPGEYFLRDEVIEINAGRRTVKLMVSNTGDRGIQVGSHFHFFEANSALDFDRNAAMGMHLNIIAGTIVRFEPGDTKEVELVEFGGMQRVVGFNGLVNGSVTSTDNVRRALQEAHVRGFKGVSIPTTEGGQ